MSETIATQDSPRESARDERDPGRTQAFVLLRFTLLIATSYMLLAENDFATLSPFVASWIGVGLLSNVAATRLPRRMMESPWFAGGSLIADTAWITVGLLAAGRFEPEFFFLYFFVLFLAAVGESLSLIALGTVVVSGAYLYALSASGGGARAILETSTLIRLPFLFAVASFYGYLVDRVRRERHQAEARGEDVERLEETRLRLEAANARLEEEIAERRKAQTALSASNERLTELAEMKSAFVSVVSHELRTPLTSIRNSIDLVRGGKTGGDLTDDQRRFLDMAKRNQERLSAIIDDLLDVSRMEAGHLDFRLEETDAVRLVTEVRESLEAQAVACGVELASEIAAATPTLPVWVDPKRLTQVLVNLVGNALKFTPEGGRVTLSARRVLQVGEIEIAVSDTGPGVPPEEREKIFEAFYQSESRGGGFLTREVRGTGLGLSISRELAQGQGGRLWVEGSPGGGSRFVLSLPGDLARAREITRFEEQVRQHKKYPLFGVLVIGWPHRATGAGGALSDPGTRYSALMAIRDELRRALPRDCDLLRVEPEHERIVLVLLATPREGTEIVKTRLVRRLESIALRLGGETLPVPEVLGPAQYPEDGATGRALVARCLDPNPEVPKRSRDASPEGATDDADHSRSRRRAGRTGGPELPTVPGGLLGGDRDRWGGSPGGRPGAPARPGPAGRHDAPGERLPGGAFPAGG